jgi:hypothetical protein
MLDAALKTDEATGDIIVPRAQTPVAAGLDGPIDPDNIAARMDATALSRLSNALTEQLAFDQNSRTGWDELAARYTEALGLGAESQSDDPQYENADTSDHPLLLRALTTYQAKALAALMPKPDRVAHAEIDIPVEDVPDAATRQEIEAKIRPSVERVQAFYNNYLLAELPNYVEDTDQIIYDNGLYGLGVRRIVDDPTSVRTPVVPVHVPLEDLTLSYDTKSFRGSGRITHRYDKATTDIVKMLKSGKILPIELTAGRDFYRTMLAQARDRQFGLDDPIYNNDGVHELYDVFCHLFLADDPHPDMLARPYIVTIHARSRQVLAIRQNWREGDPEERPLEHLVGYVYSPGRNAVTAVGLGALLTNITMALRRAQRRALDAAYLANHPAGFIVGGMSIRGDNRRIIPGSLTEVDVANGDLSKSIFMNPFKGPDPGLLSLYDKMNAEGRELGNVSSIDFQSMMKSGIAAGPALAAYDESTEFQTSVHRRLYHAHATELRIIHERMRARFGGVRVPYGNGRFLEPDDLFVARLVPAMKPGFVSRQREMVEAQAVLELSNTKPDVFDGREAAIRYLEAINTRSPQTLIKPDPATQEIKPSDPINEYMRIMRGEPVRAGLAQNHQAHIDAHTAQMEGIQKSNLPVATGQAAAAALAAHIAEHEGMQMAVAVAAQLGMDPQMFVDGVPPEIEAQIAPAVAAAIAQIEAARKPKDEGDIRIAIEQMKSDTKIAIEQMKAATAARDNEVKTQIERMVQTGETKRNNDDNFWAMEIAKVKVGKPSPRPVDNNPDQNPTSGSPVNNPNP